MLLYVYTNTDSGVVQPPTGSKWDKPQQVDSGGLTYHLTKIAYASPPSDRRLGEYQFNAGCLVYCQQHFASIGSAFEINMIIRDDTIKRHTCWTCGILILTQDAFLLLLDGFLKMVPLVL
jgi:hypothetical protein